MFPTRAGLPGITLTRCRPRYARRTAIAAGTGVDYRLYARAQTDGRSARRAARLYKRGDLVVAFGPPPPLSPHDDGHCARHERRRPRQGLSAEPAQIVMQRRDIRQHRGTEKATETAGLGADEGKPPRPQGGGEAPASAAPINCLAEIIKHCPHTAPTCDSAWEWMKTPRPKRRRPSRCRKAPPSDRRQAGGGDPSGATDDEPPGYRQPTARAAPVLDGLGW